MPKKIAIILFNLGGPDSPQAVKPFLFNLFNDKAIIGAPKPIRYALARFISSKREKEAQHIYSYIGDKSPIVEQTQAQADALEKELVGFRFQVSVEEEQASKSASPELAEGNVPSASKEASRETNIDYKTFIAMRYWHPFAEEAAREAKAWGAQEVVLLPLYPQFSTTTTGSSITDWHKAAKKAGLHVPTRAVGCYPTHPALVEAHVALLKPALEAAAQHGKPRVLFSAHGLPEKIIAAGDPYQQQVEASVAAIVKRFQEEVKENTRLKPLPETSFLTSYQSKVGPLEWIKPATDAEIIRAGKDGVPLVIVPIAFVSEHSETLVELDIQYRELAAQSGVPYYARVPALQTQPAFIKGLAEMVQKAGQGVQSGDGYRCAGSCIKCPCTTTS